MPNIKDACVLALVLSLEACGPNDVVSVESVNRATQLCGG